MKRILSLLLASLMSIAIVGCGNGNSSPADSNQSGGGNAKTNVKVGFVYIGVPGDEGYTYSHDQARKQLEEELGVETLVVENVQEDASCATSIRDLIDRGCNVIFSNSFGFMDYTLEVAQEFPDVKFFHCSGYKTNDNMSAYFGRMYQARYLSGIVAGLKTETNKIGYVAAVAIPEVIRGANAFALGVASVNPEATVEILFSGTWYDPSLERSVAKTLLDKGCDVIAQHQDTTAAQVAAEESGKFAIGYNSSTANVAPKAYLTAPIWDWSVYVIPQVQAIIDGKWEASNEWLPMDTGIVKLDELTDLCAEGTQEAVDAAMQKIADGFDVFEGPIKDNEGNVRVKEGEKLTDEEMLELNWLVENIVGTMPAD